MNCPVCIGPILDYRFLEFKIPGYRCHKCDGTWLMANEYVQWLYSQNPPSGTGPMAVEAIPTWDIPAVKACPNCGRLLMRYKVLPNGALILDRCNQCNGIWFDPKEWAFVIEQGLHFQINLFFTQPWQVKVRAEEARGMLTRLYQEKFGDEDYDKVREVWNWLNAHPRRAMLLAYLQAEDPYKL